MDAKLKENIKAKIDEKTDINDLEDWAETLKNTVAYNQGLKDMELLKFGYKLPKNRVLNAGYKEEDLNKPEILVQHSFKQKYIDKKTDTIQTRDVYRYSLPDVEKFTELAILDTEDFVKEHGNKVNSELLKEYDRVSQEIANCEDIDKLKILFKELSDVKDTIAKKNKKEIKTANKEQKEEARAVEKMAIHEYVFQIQLQKLKLEAIEQRIRILKVSMKPKTSKIQKLAEKYGVKTSKKEAQPTLEKEISEVKVEAN